MEKFRARRKTNKMIRGSGIMFAAFSVKKGCQDYPVNLSIYLYLVKASATVARTIDLSGGVISSISNSK